MKIISAFLLSLTVLLAQSGHRLQRQGFIPAAGANKSPHYQLLSRLAMNDLGGLHGEHFNVGPSTRIERVEGALPTAFLLKQNFPNPFNQTTTLFYQLAQAGEVQITVYSILGKQVARLVLGHQQAGSYRIRYDATDDGGVALASGVYFVRLQAPGYVGIVKLVLIR
jgi:hypothetical protein